MSNFDFLKTEWPDLHDPASKAEALAFPDPRAACFYARRTLELAVDWLYTHDGLLRKPYETTLNALIFEPTFRNSAGPAIHTKIRIIKDLGNLAVHSARPVRPEDSLIAVKELFHVLYWLARTYARGPKPSPTLVFDAALLPKTTPLPRQTVEQLQRLEAGLHERDARLAELQTGRAALDEELIRLRAEVAEAKKQNAAIPDTHDYGEAETRDTFIDKLLKEAGWALDKPEDREYRVTGMPSSAGEGFVDYVLWNDDGKPLAVVEAKRTKRDPRVGQQQAKLYADCLEAQFNQRPLIFYTNGYEHWFWDDAMYPPRAVQGFLTKAELSLAIQRRSSRKRLADAKLDESIVERYYQTRAIRRICEAFSRDHDRKALLVMATGSGKTRTVLALCDVLMRCNWVKRVLFLADRVALVNQAIKVFKKHLPDVSPVNLVTEKDKDGRVYVSTYPTMMGLIDETNDGQKRFGVGHFDLLVIDEAHRSVYKKYGAIFEYFDSLLVGLTATPKDEVDRNTYGLFDLQDGVPTDSYDLNDAVRDCYLVPPKSISVPVRFQRDGINYNELPEDERDEWDEQEWSDDGSVPARIEAEAVNKWLFNTDTVDKVLEHLMTHGQKVAGGDRLGKTIIFAKNHAHAMFIAERFDINYPNLKGVFARVIDFQTEYAQSLIDSFSKAADMPHIAISVDMLDTGIDVPEVVNLIFFKLVRSKTKFWQMIGRGTRLSPDLFGPGQHKEFFTIFDYCRNLEFFSQSIQTVEGTQPASLGERLFRTRLDLIGELDHQPADTGPIIEKVRELRRDVAATLRTEISAMNIDNFIVRPKRKWVEKFRVEAAWNDLTAEMLTDLSEHVAGLPSELEPEDEESKRFDLLLLKLQLTVLRADHTFTRLRDQVIKIASLLEEKAAIPMVAAQMALILDLQTDEWWQDVTVWMLEDVRKRLRDLVTLIEKVARQPIYTDFKDEIGAGVEVNLPNFTTPDNYERFRAKARQFLKKNENQITVHKLRMNEPLTPIDLLELERILKESGVGTPADIDKARNENHGLGLFVRSLVGLDREAAKRTFDGFLNGKTLNSSQIEFIDMIIDHLTEHGCMEAARLYESPYIDRSPQGVEGVFPTAQVDELLAILENLNQRAAS